MQNTGILKPVKLPYMQTYCIYYSVRFGVLVIGLFTMIQSLLIMIALGFVFKHQDWITNFVKEISSEFGEEHTEHILFYDLFQDIGAEPKSYSISLFIFFVFLFLSCIILIIGGYKCESLLTYPFIGLYFIYVTTILLLAIWTLLLLKELEYVLGMLAVLSIAVVFFLLYMYYQWFCVLSFCQILNHLKTQMEQLTTVYTNSNKNQKYY